MSSPEQASPKSESDSMRIFGLSQPTSYRKVCVRCGRWGYFASDKEVTKSRTTTARVPVLQTSCCQNIFCTDCILSTISDGLWDEIWRPQESGYGIPISCPARSCEAQRLCLDLESLIEFLLGCDIKKRTLIGSITRFRYAFQAQRSIHNRIPDMNEWQGKAGNDFHKQLALAGHMWPCDGTWPRGTMMHVARFSFRGGEPIPVFLGLFKDKVKWKPCVVCDGQFMETSSGEVLTVVFYMFGDTQRTPRTGKSGFPPRSVFLDCHSQHKLNCCFRCHDFNIAAKLDDNQEVTCPEEGCKNILTPSQVEAVARPDTRARYDKMQLQKGLDTMPCFRWCVNEHCSAGQDNDLEGCSPEYKFFIECNACHLPMCFLHGRVWHFGQTCEEYDIAHDLVGGRDPETDRWLLEHAKPCPGCKVPVEKNGGCFHMTCKSCKMEFCWVCLADWKKIRRLVDGRMTYDVSGHNSECDFRQTHVQPHLAIGNNVGDAIRDAEELFWLMPQ